MPELDITYKDFDTVCYSTQYNVIQLIKHCVGIALQVNINIGDITNLFSNVQNIYQNIGDLQELIDKINEAIDKLEQSGEDTSGDLNSLVLRVNALERDLSTLQKSFDIFSSAVNQDLKELRERIIALEAKVG